MALGPEVAAPDDGGGNGSGVGGGSFNVNNYSDNAGLGFFNDGNQTAPLHSRVCAGFTINSDAAILGASTKAQFCYGVTDLADSGLVIGIEGYGGITEKTVKSLPGIDYGMEYSWDTFMPTDEVVSYRDFTSTRVGFLITREDANGPRYSFRFSLKPAAESAVDKLGLLKLHIRSVTGVESNFSARTVGAGLQVWYRDALRLMGYPP